MAEFGLMFVFLGLALRLIQTIFKKHDLENYLILPKGIAEYTAFAGLIILFLQIII